VSVSQGAAAAPGARRTQSQTADTAKAATPAHCSRSTAGVSPWANDAASRDPSLGGNLDFRRSVSLGGTRRHVQHSACQCGLAFLGAELRRESPVSTRDDVSAHPCRLWGGCSPPPGGTSEVVSGPRRKVTPPERPHRQQDGDLDPRRFSFASRQVAGCGNGPRWTSARSARPHRPRASRDLRGRRYRRAQSGRKAASRRCPGSDARGALRGRCDSSARCADACTSTIPLLRQGHHGRRRPGIRDLTKRQAASQWIRGMAGLGRRAHPVSGPTRAPPERPPPVDVDAADRPTWITTHREPPQRELETKTAQASPVAGEAMTRAVN
jgi:hypothetical protein